MPSLSVFIQLLTLSSAWKRVRSTWMGVTETKPRRTALKSVPGPASSTSPAGPIHHIGRPRGRSEEHTSELQSLMRISYAVFCLKKKTHKPKDKTQSITKQ